MVVSLLAMFAVWISGGPHWLRSALTALVGAFGGVAVARVLRPRIRSLLWRPDGGVDFTFNDTPTDGCREVEGAIYSARVMGPLIVLTLGWSPRERVSLWLLPDNLDADTHRRLRMRLGAGGSGAPSSGNADSG